MPALQVAGPNCESGPSLLFPDSASSPGLRVSRSCLPHKEAESQLPTPPIHPAFDSVICLFVHFLPPHGRMSCLWEQNHIWFSLLSPQCSEPCVAQNRPPVHFWWWTKYNIKISFLCKKMPLPFKIWTEHTVHTIKRLNGEEIKSSVVVMLNIICTLIQIPSTFWALANGPSFSLTLLNYKYFKNVQWSGSSIHLLERTTKAFFFLEVKTSNEFKTTFFNALNR